jgi:subtilase-type serine protease
MVIRKKNPTDRQLLSRAIKTFIPVLLGTGMVQAQSVFETTEYFNQPGLALINVKEAYELGYTGAGIRVGILDSGIASRHPEFAGQVAGGYDFGLHQAVTEHNGIDIHGHGSHVSGIIAARRDGIGMHGVAFDAKIIMTYGDLDDGSANPSYQEQARLEDEAYSRGWNYLAKQGLPVINNSVGVVECEEGKPSDGSRPCNIGDFLPDAAPYFDAHELFPKILATMPKFLATDTLMVFATGNEAQMHPDFLAGMPAVNPDLKPNWLAVTAVNADMDVKNPGLTDYANRCGLAKSWCLAAPGSNNDEDGIYSVRHEGGYIDFHGTSMAAPHVTGAAALVKQAFPFFSAHQLQQTLLTTATDLTPNDGNRLDERFGWGLLNVGKAVQGPGLFVSNFDVDTSGYDASFSNDIGDLFNDPDFLGQAGSLTKRGAGTLSLSGHNSYRGPTRVEAGTLLIAGTQSTGDHIVNGGQLVVNGRIASSSTTTVNPYGTLSGSGSLGPLNNKGRVAPGNSVGTLTVIGDYTAFAGSRLAIEADAQNRVDVLQVSGNATLHAGSVLSLESGPWRQGLDYNFLQTAGVVTNLGLEIDTSLVFLTPSLMASGAGLSLNLSRNATAFARFASGHNQTAVANALDPFSALPPAAMQGIYDDLLNARADNFGGILNQLSGEAHASLQSALLNQGRLWTHASTQRMNSLLSEAPDRHRPLWFSLQHQSADLNGHAGTADVQSRTNGLFFGADFAAGSDSYLGAAFGYQDGRTHIGQRNSTADTNSYSLALYGTRRWALDNDHALQWRASGAWTQHEIDMTRNPVTVGGQQRLSTSYHSRQGQLFTELGYALPLSSQLSLEPYGRLDWIWQDNGRFTEGGGPAALHGKDNTRGLGSLTLGLRSHSDIELRPNTSLQLTGELGWRHTDGNLTPKRQMQFERLQDASFKVQGAPISRNSLEVALAAEMNIAKKASLGFKYNGQFGNGNTDNTGSVYLNIRF